MLKQSNEPFTLISHSFSFTIVGLLTLRILLVFLFLELGFKPKDILIEVLTLGRRGKAKALDITTSANRETAQKIWNW